MGIELPDPRCEQCLRNSWNVAVERHALPANTQRQFREKMDQILAAYPNETAPELQRCLSHAFSAATGNTDPYLPQKQHSNAVALKLYPMLKQQVNASDDPFDLALRLALAANIMDYGAAAAFDLQKTIKDAQQTKLAIDHRAALRTAISDAGQILYLADNAGEIYFDKLLIETIAHPNVTFVVRGGPSLNDALLADAKEAGIADVVKQLISNGYNAPSTIVEKSSQEFQETFYRADLIISKGMGNLEGLMKRADPRIFFLLMAKCNVIADYLGVAKGSFVVAHKQNQSTQ